jgi:hypothetical protein
MEGFPMIVMIVYVVLVAIGEVAAFFVCQVLDTFIPAAWSMLVYMGMFFGVIWAVWPVSVFVTEKWFVRQEPARAK